MIHCNGTVHQVAQNVGQLRVYPLDDQFIGHRPIIGEWDLVEDKVADCIHSELIYQVIGVDHVANGFAHLVVAH